jgi:FkbH-like protein
MLRSNFYSIQESLIKFSGNRHEISIKEGPYLATNRVFLIRNEAYEPYLAHGVNCAAQIGVNLLMSYSDYDDSLRYVVIPEESNQIVIWINWDRIPSNQISRYFESKSLISSSSANEKYYFVLPSEYGAHDVALFQSKLTTIGWPTERIIAGFNSHSDEKVKIKMGYTREELDSISTKIGVQASSNLSSIRIRALILDLDNTLYRGVFGEDSSHEVFPDDEHLKLHLELKKLKESGVLLCIATKNNLTDVESVFQLKLTSVLEKNDFSIISGGWESKAKSIEGILRDLNFSENFVAFIDDNQRELYEVGRTFPNMMCVDGKKTEALLKVLATCLTFEKSQDTKVSEARSKDIRASRLRQELSKKNVSPDSILVDLNTKLEASKVSSLEEFQRAFELFRKTNQFNLTLKRSTSEINDYETLKEKLITASIKDDISNSGVIAAVKVLDRGDLIELQEFSISCRALGRNVEKYLFRAMLSKIDKNFEKLQVGVQFEEGPKNQPALDFVQRFFVKERQFYILDSGKLLSETSEWYPYLCDL